MDASLAVKVVVAEPDSAKADALFDEWADAGTHLLAPAVLAVETDSLLRQKVTLRKELTAEQAEAAFRSLTTLTAASACSAVRDRKSTRLNSSH